jgi:hypothetical protein
MAMATGRGFWRGHPRLQLRIDELRITRGQLGLRIDYVLE